MVKLNMETAMKVKNLNFYYGESQALFNVNVEFKKNHVTAIIGHSGSGKSTLVRVLNRIYELYPEQSAKGEVIYKDENIVSKHYHDVEKLRMKVGMVFQKPTPFPMSIYNNIAFALKNNERLSGQKMKDRVKKALKQAALWDEVKDTLKKGGSELSGGQQQRLCMARTLAMEPDILLLDEPTSALDPVSTQQIEELILQLKEKYTIILVTHNLKQAERIADTVIFMKDGQIKEMNERKEFFENPQSKSLKAYLSHM